MEGSKTRRAGPRQGTLADAETGGAVLRAVAEIAASGDPGLVASLAVEHAGRLLRLEGAVLFAWQLATGLLEPLYETSSTAREAPVLPGQGMVGQAFATGASVVAPDYQVWEGAIPGSAARGMRGAVAVPLIAEGRPVGVIGGWTYSPRDFTAAEVELLQLLANLVAPVLETARLGAEREARLASLRALHDIAVAAGGMLDIHLLAALVADRARDLLGVEACTFLLWDERERVLRPLRPMPGLADPIYSGEGVAGRAFERGEPVAVENYQGWEGALLGLRRSGYASVMAAPLTIEGSPIGCIVAATSAPRHVTAADTGMLALLAAQVAPTVRAARLHSELAASEERYRALYQAMACGVLMQDASGRMTHANQAASRILGLPAEAIQDVQVTAATAWKAWDEDGVRLDPDRHPSTVARLEGVEVRDQVVRVHSPSRGDLWLRLDAVPVRDPAGTVQGVVTTFIDVTDLRRAEAARRQTQERLASVVRDAPVVLYSLDREGRITLAEGQGMPMALPGGSGSLVGSLAAERWESPAARQMLRRALDRGEPGEAVIHFEDLGLDLDMRIRPTRDARGKVTAAVVVATDVTKRLRAERELRSSREQLAWLAANAPLMLFVIDTQKVVTLVEGKALEGLGLKASEVVGRSVSELIQGDEMADEHVDRGLAGGSGRVEVRLGGVDFEVLYRPLRDEAGRLTGVIGVGVDVTERHRAEEAVRESEAKSRFLAGMSHELRTPLNSVLGFAQLLQDKDFGPLTARQRRYVGHIHSSGEHLLSLINDVLDLTRVASGQVTLTPEDLIVRQRLEQTIARLQPLASAKGLRVRLAASPGLGVRADPLRLDQVIWNLLSNAIKFTGEGGEVRVRARRWKGRVEIAVSDTGVGIPASDRARIFDEFTQVESGTSRRHEGTGLGLALSRRLVELMDGTIGVESRVGHGSTFTVTLPEIARPAPP